MTRRYLRHVSKLSTRQQLVSCYASSLADKLKDGSAVGTVRVKMRRKHQIWVIVASVPVAPQRQRRPSSGFKPKCVSW